MIHQFKVKNFSSFADEACVDFTVGKGAPNTDAFVTTPFGDRLSKLMVVIGPNGSGKTNLLKALVFLRWFMLHSFADSAKEGENFFLPFLGAVTKKSSFSVQFSLAEKIYKYEIDFTLGGVLKEALYFQNKRGFSYIFKCNRDNSLSNLKIKIQDLEGVSTEYLKPMMRKNCSFFSLLNQMGENPLAKIATYFDIFTTNVNVGSNIDPFLGHLNFELPQIEKYYSDNSSALKWASQQLVSLDFGLSDINIHKIPKADGAEESADSYLTLANHSSDGNEFQLPLVCESRGTKKLYVLLGKLYAVLQNGGIAVLDEFEADLHPNLLASLLELFIAPETNPLNAQLFFSCHAPEVLTQLDKTQVLLVEKDDDCRSEAWRLDSVKGVRRDDNLYAKYMSGAYAAVPRI